jgi:PIN domain nuclease of toxin-antitoxin system
VIVLDTVTLIYWTVRPELLSSIAKQAIADADTLVISSISIWELAIKSRKGHIDLTVPIREYVSELEQVPQLQIKPVDEETWLVSTELDWQHRDPADRVIVATATLLKCPLVTSDRVIAGFYASTIW